MAGSGVVWSSNDGRLILGGSLQIQLGLSTVNPALPMQDKKMAFVLYTAYHIGPLFMASFTVPKHMFDLMHMTLVPVQCTLLS